MKKKQLTRQVMAVAIALSQTFTAFAAAPEALTSGTNAANGQSKVILDNKYWYKVRMPGVIDLQFDEDSQTYRDDYKVYVKGETPGKYLQIDTDDVNLVNSDGDEITIGNYIGQTDKGHKNHRYVYGSGEGDNESLTPEEALVTGLAIHEIEDVKMGDYSGLASYRFKLVDSLEGEEYTDTAEENRSEADCEKDGSYDVVKYKKGTKEELSREKITLPHINHWWPDEYHDEDGEMVRYCLRDKSHRDFLEYTKYDIEYDLQGGEIKNEPTQYTKVDSIKLPIPTKEGFNFDGWTVEGSDERIVNYTIPKGQTGNIKFTAHWVKGGEAYVIKRLSDINTTQLAQEMKKYLDNVGEKEISGNSMDAHGASEEVKQETTSTFPWQTNLNPTIGSITIKDGGKNVNFKGNERNAGSNAIWYIPEQGSEQKFNFGYDLNFGDSFNGAGFLLRVKDNGSSISGYALNLNKTGSAQLSKFTRPKNTTANITWTPVKSLGISTKGTLTVTATTTYVEIEGGGLAKTKIPLDENYVLNSCGSGYGFYSDHYSHGCSNIGNFDITNLNLTTTTVLSMADVLNKTGKTGTGTSADDFEPIFERADAIHFVINVDSKIDKALEDPVLIERLKKENAHIIFIGSSANKAHAEKFINAVGAGTFIQTTNNAKTDAANAADYMHKVLKEAGN